MGSNKPSGNKKPYVHDWTEEETDTLIRAWTDGLPVAQIVKQLGAGLTKNAVVAKAYRLKLPTHPTAVLHHGNTGERKAPHPEIRIRQPVEHEGQPPEEGLARLRPIRLHRIGFETRRLPGEPETGWWL